MKSPLVRISTRPKLAPILAKLGPGLLMLGTLNCALVALGQEVTDVTEVTAVSTRPAEPREEALAPKCVTDLRLSGAFYNGTRPERSFAVFEVPPGHGGSVYRIGTWIAGFELIEVAPRGVFLRGHDGNECWVQLEGQPANLRVRADTSGSARKPSRPKKAKRPKKNESVVIGHASAR